MNSCDNQKKTIRISKLFVIVGSAKSWMQKIFKNIRNKVLVEQVDTDTNRVLWL